MLTIESLWLSGRASEHRIQRSVVWFLMGTPEVFLCPMFMTRWKKRLSLFLYRAQNLPSFLIYIQNTTTLSTLLILPVCSMHVICEFCNGPSICFIRCVASGSGGHTRESAPLQLWDINRWADYYHDYSIWLKFLS